jgi:plasmid stabilization system protein ParE
VARVVYTPAAVRDLERLVDFLLNDDAAAAFDTAELVTEALSMLEKHPLLGRATTADLRELVISRGQSGYLALYDYDVLTDLVLVLGIRHQREAGYSDPAVPE